MLPAHHTGLSKSPPPPPLLPAAGGATQTTSSNAAESTLSSRGRHAVQPAAFTTTPPAGAVAVTLGTAGATAKPQQPPAERRRAQQQQQQRPTGGAAASSGGSGSREGKVPEIPKALQNLPRVPIQAIENGPLSAIATLLRQFSKAGAQSGVLRLITIPYSPYCEKVRWAIQRSAIRHTEDAHSPGLHVVETLAVSEGAWSAVPIAVFPNGEVVWDSSSVLGRLQSVYPRHASWLYPEPIKDRVQEWEQQLDEILGPNVRQWMYCHILQDRSLCRRLFQQHVPAIHRAGVTMALHDILKALTRSMKIVPAYSSHYLACVDEIFAVIDDALADGRKYLCGNRLTAADVTFAALAYPMVLPPQMDSLFLPLSRLPKEMQDVIIARRRTKTGQYILRLYEEDRFPDATLPGARVGIISGNRTRIPAWLILLVTISLVVGFWVMRFLMHNASYYTRMPVTVG